MATILNKFELLLDSLTSLGVEMTELNSMASQIYDEITVSSTLQDVAMYLKMTVQLCGSIINELQKYATRT